MRLVRTIAIVSVAFIVMAGFVGCSSKKETPRAGGTSSPSVSPITGSSGNPTPGGSASPSSGATSGGAKKSSSTGGGVAPPPGSKAFVARPAGLYTFTTSGSTQISGPIKRAYKFPARTTLSVSGPSGGVQRAVRDLRDSDGNGRMTETRVRSASDGLHLEYLKNTSRFAGITDVREFTPKPPPLILRTGAPNGDHLSFTMSGSDVTVVTTVDVLRREAVSIGGKTIQAIVIKITTDFSGDVSGHGEATNWLRPTDGLLLREDDYSEVQSGFAHVTSNYQAKLDSLTPA